MSDAEQLFWVLTAFTVAFGAVWVRPGGTLFLAHAWERHRLVWASGRALLLNENGGLLLGNVFPVGSSVVAAPWPLTVSPVGVLAAAPSAPTPDGRIRESGRFVAFADLRRVSCDGAALLVNDAPFVVAASKTAAARWAKWLDELRALPEADRGGWIERALAASCDVTAAGDAVRACRRQTRWLRGFSTTLFAYCFAALGATAFAGVAIPLGSALPGYFALLAMTYLAFRRAAGAAGVSAGHGWMLLVSPVDAFRAADQVTRPRLEVFHPLALSRVLADRPAHEAFARRVALDLGFPLPSAATVDARAAAAARWFAGRLRRTVAGVFRESGIDPAACVAPPPPDDPASVGYCPRCRGQYVHAAGPCSACGLALRSFADPPTVVPWWDAPAE